MVTRRLVDLLARPAVAPLVGRASEIVRLTAWHTALTSGEGRVALPRTITPDAVRALAAANLADGCRRAKTRRFLAGSFDRVGRDDPHFGPEWAFLGGDGPRAEAAPAIRERHVDASP